MVIEILLHSTACVTLPAAYCWCKNNNRLNAHLMACIRHQEMRPHIRQYKNTDIRTWHSESEIQRNIGISEPRV